MTFTIDQIRAYLLSQDSLGDILYNLSEEAIIKANRLRLLMFIMECGNELFEFDDETGEYCSGCNYKHFY